MEASITSGGWMGSGQRPSSPLLAPVILPADSWCILPTAAVDQPRRRDAAAAGEPLGPPIQQGWDSWRAPQHRVSAVSGAAVWTGTTPPPSSGRPVFLTWLHPFRPVVTAPTEANRTFWLFLLLSNRLTIEMQKIALNYWCFKVCIQNHRSEHNCDDAKH